MNQDLTKLSDQELQALYSKKFGNRPIEEVAKELESKKAQTPQVDVNELLRTQQSPGIASDVGNFLTRLGGKEPATQSGDLYKTYMEKILGEQAKKLYEDPIDVQLQRDYKRAATERAMRDPFYMTDLGQGYYQAGTQQKQAQGEQAAVETNLMKQVMPAVQSAMEGNNGQLPPGASISAGPVTFQPNPRLTDTEQAAVAGSQALEPVVQRILQEVSSGIYGQGNDLERTARQGIVDSGNALLSSKDERLQAFQSDINNLKRLIPFTDGGKQLTPFEAKRVFALLNTVGKNDQQIGKDIQSAVSIVMAKGGLAIGGRNAALGGQQQPVQNVVNQPGQLSDEQAYQEYLKMTGNQ